MRFMKRVPKVSQHEDVFQQTWSCNQPPFNYALFNKSESQISGRGKSFGTRSQHEDPQPKCKNKQQTNLFLPPNSTSHIIMSSNFFIISSHHQEGCQHRKQHGCVDLHNFDLFGTLGWHIIPSPRCQPRHHRLQLRQLRPCGGALSPPHACGAGDGGATYGCFREGGAVIGWLVEDVYWLVVSTPLKNMLVKIGSSSPNRGEHKTYLKPPPSIWVFPKIGVYTPKWMVKIMQQPY